MLPSVGRKNARRASGVTRYVYLAGEPNSLLKDDSVIRRRAGFPLDFARDGPQNAFSAFIPAQAGNGIPFASCLRAKRAAFDTKYT